MYFLKLITEVVYLFDLNQQLKKHLTVLRKLPQGLSDEFYHFKSLDSCLNTVILKLYKLINITKEP